MQIKYLLKIKNKSKLNQQILQIEDERIYCWWLNTWAFRRIGSKYCKFMACYDVFLC
jgi:hypothetical protein